MTDEELDGAESPNWIAVYKPGLSQLVKDHAAALLRIADLETENKLLKRPTEDGYR